MLMYNNNNKRPLTPKSMPNIYRYKNKWLVTPESNNYSWVYATLKHIRGAFPRALLLS